MTSHEPWLQTPEHPVPLAGVYKAIKRFNRNTTWVATGLLGSVIFAALMVAHQERHAKVDDLAKEARQTGDLLLNANPAAISDGSNEKPTEITSGQPTSVDRDLTPQINDPDVQANATSWSLAHGPDSARAIGLKVPRARSRSSVRLRFVDVKARLIALWHQSLMPSEKSRGWNLFSNSNKWRKKKISYTAATIH